MNTNLDSTIRKVLAAAVGLGAVILPIALSDSASASPAIALTPTSANTSFTVTQVVSNFVPFTINNDTSTDTFTLTSSSSLHGLTIGAHTGIIAGTISGSAATETFTIVVADSSTLSAPHEDTKTVLITINAAPTATAGAAKTLVGGVAASYTPVTGALGTGSLTYSISSADSTTLASHGLTLNRGTGVPVSYTHLTLPTIYSV